MALTLKYSSAQHVMGTTATITVLGQQPEEHVAQGQEILRELHLMWSRFISTSDISRINNARGSSTWVSQQTIHLIHCMKLANVATKGWYNPTLLPLQHHMGDDTSLHNQDKSEIPSDARPYATLETVEIIDSNHVRIPADMTLDAGGIGKGLAAEMIAAKLLSDNALSVSINIGGDIRVGCAPHYEHDWNIEVVDFNKSPLSTVSLRNGAIATSASNVRSQSNSHLATHVLSMKETPDARLRSASVISSNAMWAEVWTKYVMLAPEPFADLEPTGQAAMLAVEGSAPIFSAHWKEYEL